MDKKDRIAIVNLHHGLGQCRQDAWESVDAFFKREGISLTFREVSTIQSVYRHQLTQKDPLSLTDLANRIHLKNAITSQTVSSLVEKGIMLRENAESNRRKVMISLSRRGMEIAEGLALLADELLEKYLSPLTDAERAELFRIAKKLNPRLPY